MVKKARTKKMKKSKSKQSTTYTCDTCGIVLAVVDPCDCTPCDVICCGENMRIGVC